MGLLWKKIRFACLLACQSLFFKFEFPDAGIDNDKREAHRDEILSCKSAFEKEDIKNKGVSVYP
jgi:hypothetical protein